MSKKIVLFLLFMGFACIRMANAQEKRMMLFEKYVQGTVLMINNAHINISLNYDTANHQMMYLQDHKEMILTNNDEVDTIYIQHRKFIPYGNLYLELISLKNGEVFINWELRKISKGKVGAYGQVTQSNVDVINTREFTGTGEYIDQYVDVYSLFSNNEYWLLRNNKYVKCRKIKDVLKNFPVKVNSIKLYIAKHHINFSITKDALSLLNFCMEK